MRCYISAHSRVYNNGRLRVLYQRGDPTDVWSRINSRGVCYTGPWSWGSYGALLCPALIHRATGHSFLPCLNITCSTYIIYILHILHPYKLNTEHTRATWWINESVMIVCSLITVILVLCTWCTALYRIYNWTSNKGIKSIRIIL